MTAPYQPDRQVHPEPSHLAQALQMGNTPEQCQAPLLQSDLLPSYHFKPPPDTSTTATVVVTGQPTAATTTCTSSPVNAGNVLATFALVLSTITTICCGVYLIYPCCIIPAFVLAILARDSTGSKQKSIAAIGIGLNAAVIATVCFLVVFFVVFPLPTYLQFPGPHTPTDTAAAPSTVS